jgi:hypothetical protein
MMCVFLYGKINRVKMTGDGSWYRFPTLLAFLVALMVSAAIIYGVTKLFGEMEDIKTAFIAALVGTVAYTIVYFL